MRANDAAFRQEVIERIARLDRDPGPPALLGFDGFVDNIIDAVDERSGPDAYRPIASLRDFGGRVGAAAGRGTNVELVVRQTKVGGNGPIMAGAMGRLRHPFAYIGTLGAGTPEPVFAGLVEMADEAVSLGQPAVTDALEFADGKLMLGKTEPLGAITVERLEQAVGRERLVRMLGGARGIATVNWTMVLGMTTIWRYLIDEILPGLFEERPRWFVDLADPAKRPVADLRRALRTLSELQDHADVILSLNEAEAGQVLAVLDEGRELPAGDLAAAVDAAGDIRGALGLDRVVVHLIPSSASAGPAGGAGSLGFSTRTPLITTGGGDHFNAGFFAALLRGFPDEACHLVANAVSGFYVRRAESPTWTQLREFLAAPPAPDADR